MILNYAQCRNMYNKSTYAVTKDEKGDETARALIRRPESLRWCDTGILSTLIELCSLLHAAEW